MAEESTITTTGAILAVIAGLTTILINLPNLVARKPTYGPRLRKGELKASESSKKASDAYWAAEENASRGNCRIAHRAYTVAEMFRAQAEERRDRGDFTGKNLRPLARAARNELKRCKNA